MSKSETRNGENKSTVRIDSELEWNSINWKQIEITVARLQARIVKAQREGKYSKVKSLSRILTRSFAAKALAVKKVSSNIGSKTPGIDGIIWNTAESKAQAVQNLTQNQYRAKPLKRKYIQKQDSDKMRPLGIPTMADRAMQALYQTALSPIAETIADDNSYGFRPKRCCQDAIDQIAGLMSRQTRPHWILEGDIKGCFDNISHEWIIANVPVEKKILRQWLKCGYIDKKRLFPTTAGTPQGGIISPTIANIVLDGIETMLNQRYKKRTKAKGKDIWKSPSKEENHHVNFIRYADDFIVTADSKELIENEIKPLIRGFLEDRGLQLSENKTLTTHIEEGFDFLGFNIRTYKGKLVIKPAKERVKRFKQKISEIISAYYGTNAEKLIDKLNPILIGWANYYRYVSSSKTFKQTSDWLWSKLWHWANRRHPKKNKKWVKEKYFTKIEGRDWIFYVKTETGTNKTLFEIASVKILRHLKIRKNANPFAKEDSAYFTERSKNGTIARKSKQPEI